MSKKPLEFDCIAGTQIRDTQGETLDVSGADISHLEQGLGLWNDNHGKGYFNTLGRITLAKKILSKEDCDDDRQRYYWEKVKSPYIYAKGFMFDDEDHPNAKAAAAILRNIHKTDCPLKLKASVEGGVQARGLLDPNLLARTKITKVALTFTPANNATLVEPINLDKSNTWEQDEMLIKSVLHLARTDVPSFRHITRQASAEKISDNFNKIRQMAKEAGFKTQLPEYSTQDMLHDAVMFKISENVRKINELSKALTAGYAGATSPSSKTGGAVLQTESLNDGRHGLQYITCDNCGDEQVYMKHQIKCRECGNHYPFSKLSKIMMFKSKV